MCTGVEAFEVEDELYLCPVFEERVTPLLTTAAEIAADSMVDSYREVRYGERVTAAPQTGSHLLGWTRDHGDSRIVYLLPGHGPSTMANAQFRRLLANACAWVAPTVPYAVTNRAAKS